jgi:NADH-quinone oxidoreductase subunit A
MVAMLFLIFDVEAVFVYPWAVVLRELGWAGLWQMVVFLGILGVAFVYEFCRGEELVRSSPRWTDPMLVVSRTGQ